MVQAAEGRGSSDSSAQQSTAPQAGAPRTQALRLGEAVIRELEEAFSLPAVTAPSPVARNPEGAGPPTVAAQRPEEGDPWQGQPERALSQQPLSLHHDEDGLRDPGTTAELASEYAESYEVPAPAVRQHAERKLVPVLLAGDLLALTSVGLLQLTSWPHLLGACAIFLPLLYLLGLYQVRLRPAVLDDLPRIAIAAIVSSSAVSLPALLDEGQRDLIAVSKLALATAGALLLARTASYWAVRHFRRGHPRPTLLVGYGRTSVEIARALKRHPEFGLHPVGIVGDRPQREEGDLAEGLYLGRGDTLQQLVSDREVQCLVLTRGATVSPEVARLLIAQEHLEEIYYVPRLFELRYAGAKAESVAGFPLVRLRSPRFERLGWKVKRVLDFLLSAIALVVLAPAMAVIAALIRWETGSVLFHQERVGLDGRPFTLHRFVSLRPVDDGESATLWNVSSDPRLGPVGRLIRRTGLDELPQLWNVLKGDMSLVGPRPERPYFVAQFAKVHPEYVLTHRVRAGLTGWAQVNALRGDTAIRERARFDNYYVENWSLWLDIKIILRTVVQVIRGT